MNVRFVSLMLFYHRYMVRLDNLDGTSSDSVPFPVVDGEFVLLSFFQFDTLSFFAQASGSYPIILRLLIIFYILYQFQELIYSLIPPVRKGQ